MSFLTAHSFAKSLTQYRVGVEGLDYYPHFAFGYRETSFSKVVLDRFAQEQNISFEYIPLPIKRMEILYKEDKIDFRFPDNVMWRETQFDRDSVIYSTPLVTVLAGTTVLKSKVGRSRASINSIGTLLGFHPGLWADKLNVKKFKFLHHSSVASVVNMGLDNIVDGLEIDYSVIHFHLSKMGKKKALVLDPTLPTLNVSYSLSTVRHTALINQFNLFVKNNRVFINDTKKRFNIIETPLDLNSFQ